MTAHKLFLTGVDFKIRALCTFDFVGIRTKVRKLTGKNLEYLQLFNAACQALARMEDRNITWAKDDDSMFLALLNHDGTIDLQFLLTENKLFENT